MQMLQMYFAYVHIAVHCNTEETHHLVNTHTLSSCQVLVQMVLLVETTLSLVRGGIVDQDAPTGSCRRYFEFMCLDVFESEPETRIRFASS